VSVEESVRRNPLSFYKTLHRVVKNPVYMLALKRSLSLTEKEISKWGAVQFKGLWTKSVETPPCNEKELVKKIVSSFNAAKKAQANVTEPYQPSGGWKNWFDDSWKEFYEYISKENYERVADVLRNFFRTEAVAGLWGASSVFQDFCALSHTSNKAAQMYAEDLTKKHYLVWRKNLPSVDLKELDAPHVGNPFGYCFNDFVLLEPVFEYNFQAHYFDKLLTDVQMPVVIEIGGGFGGLAYHLLRCRPSIKYISFDLPENLLIQTYYLSCLFPDARIAVYQESGHPLTLKELDNYDIVLLPNFEFERTDSLIADLIINVRSLSEMSYDTIAEYFAQIDRVGRLFFFHENICEPRKDSFFGIPSTSFPSLKNFTQILASESRWPKYGVSSAYHCQENLFIRRSVISNLSRHD
jgi:putative sugar O-methyltransferase